MINFPFPRQSAIDEEVRSTKTWVTAGHSRQFIRVIALEGNNGSRNGAIMKPVLAHTSRYQDQQQTTNNNGNQQERQHY